MKKLLLILVGLLVAVISASAQYIDGSVPTDSNEQAAFLQNVNYIQLLNKENKQLNNRAIALSLTVGGVALLEIASSSMTEQYNDGSTGFTKMGTVFALTGIVSGMVGGTWLLVNEYNLISTRKKINEHTIMQLTPAGVTISF